MGRRHLKIFSAKNAGDDVFGFCFRPALYVDLFRARLLDEKGRR